MTDVLELGEWWSALEAAALVGTARRELPASPLPVADRDDASTEASLLDQVALGTAVRRAGRMPSPASEDDRPTVAPDDRLPLAPARARQLLDLLLTQSPVGPRLAQRAIATWLVEAARTGFRVHHATLVPLLDLATASRQLRSAVVPVLDQRGPWLAELNPAWGWVLEDGSVAAASSDDAGWASLPTAERALRLRSLRAADAARARDLLLASWAKESAPARVELLRALAVGLGPDDEPFLEDALDDRSASVREVAYLLLDRLPGSARAHRLGELLAGLLSTSGVVRKKVHVELPVAPDAAAVRDGLGKAPKGRSERGLWLQRIAAGAPLDVWTATTGVDASTVVRTVEDRDALAGIRQAAVGRGDVAWCRALLDLGWDPALARCLPDAELADRMLDRVGQVKTVGELTAAVRIAPGPWSPQTSERIVARLTRLERPRLQLTELVEVLAAGLHPSTASRVQRLAVADDGTVTALQQLSQYLSLVPTITEAFR